MIYKILLSSKTNDSNNANEIEVKLTVPPGDIPVSSVINHDEFDENLTVTLSYSIDEEKTNIFEKENIKIECGQISGRVKSIVIKNYRNWASLGESIELVRNDVIKSVKSSRVPKNFDLGKKVIAETIRRAQSKTKKNQDIEDLQGLITDQP